jgi:hypothetical protein
MATAPNPRVALKAKTLKDWEKAGILAPRSNVPTTLAIDPSGNLVEIPIPKEVSPTTPNTPTVASLGDKVPVRRPILEKSNAQQNKAFLNWKKGGAKKTGTKSPSVAKSVKTGA